MKKLLTLLITTVCLAAFAAEYSTDDISFKNGLYVDKQNQPITGLVTGPNFSTTLENGRHNGSAVFFRDGRVAFKASGISEACQLEGFDSTKYKTCLPDGEVKVYNMYGELIMEIKVKNGAITNFSYEDGQLISEETRIDGKLDGKSIYYSFGKKNSEVVYKMGIDLNIKEFYRDGELKSEVRKENGLSVWGACYDRQGAETVLTKEDLELFDLLGGYLNCGSSDSGQVNRTLQDAYRRGGEEE